MNHLVFVYGSLKQGYGNHHFVATSKFLGETRTLKRAYKMLALGSFPGVFKGGKHSIEGELYEVNDLVLSNLDRLESNGYFYKRELILLANGQEAWMYVCLQEPCNQNKTRVRNTRNHTQVWLSAKVGNNR